MQSWKGARLTRPNLVLDGVDRELERRGHRFVRYADGCNIYVNSERAGQRVMESVTRFITDRLKLKLNQAKRPTRYRELRQRGIRRELAARTAGSPRGPWRIANSRALSIASPAGYFSMLGLPAVVVRSWLNPPNHRMRNPHDVRWCGRGGQATVSPIPLARKMARIGLLNDTQPARILHSPQNLPPCKIV